MDQKEKSEKELKAMEQVKKANAKLAKVRRDEKKKLRKDQDHHKYMMGGVIENNFPDAYDFSELEMNRIIACAFKNPNVQNMISVVVNERKNTANSGQGSDEEGGR